MDDKFIENPDHKPFFRKIETMTDRELKEMSLYYQRENNKDLERIKLNVQFFFWLFIVTTVLLFFIGTKLK
jgi:hypothetical protein